MALLSYHSARRGFLGFLTYITGSDGVARGGVIPAMTLTSSAGVEVTSFGGGDATAANQVIQSGKLDTLHADLTASTPAGTNIIGKVGIDQTTQGTTNAVVATGKFNTTTPTLTDGQYGNLQLSTFGGALICSTNRAAGSDGILNSNNVGMPSHDGTTCLFTVSPHLFNGTTWDRQRGDTNGLVTQQFAMAGNRWSYAAATGGIVNTTTAVTIASAAGAGIRNYLAGIQIDNDTLGAATEFAVRDGAAGTVLWRGKLQTAAGSRAHTFPAPLRGSANTLMEVVTLTAVTGGVFFNGQGFTGA